MDESGDIQYYLRFPDKEQASRMEEVKARDDIQYLASRKQEESIEQTLLDREKKYGSFHERAQITQRLKNVMDGAKNWQHLSDAKKEVLEMIAVKIGRILNGDPNYKDSWHDIIGYVKLVDDDPNEVQWQALIN